MTKITPYTALCAIFQSDEQCNRENITGTEKHGNEVILENLKSRKYPKMDNSCQTQPLRDYSIDKVIKAQKKNYSHIQRGNMASKDDNFKILHPDYAAYSGEKPYVDYSPVEHKFKNIAERPCTVHQHDGRKTSTIKHTTPISKSGKRKHTTANLEEEDLFQPTKPSYNRYDNKRYPPHFDTTDDFIELKYRHTKDFPERNTNRFHPSLKDPKVNALYRTVSNLQNAFANKYHHDHDEKCLCEHCGALTVVKESLKHPIIYDTNEDEDYDPHHERRYRKHRSRKDKYNEKEYLKLIEKLRMMEERLEELEGMNYIKGPLKTKETSNMCTQCGKSKRNNLAESECRQFSPKRFYHKACPFSLTIPNTFKEKIFRQKNVDERSSSRSEDSDDSDYNFKPMNKSAKHGNVPKPILRSHDYVNKKKQQQETTNAKKTGFWNFLPKTYYVGLAEAEDFPNEENTITEKAMKDLLFEINNIRNKSPTSTLEEENARFYLKSKDTGVLYTRLNTDISSNSEMKFLLEQSNTTNSENIRTDLNVTSDETSYDNSQNQFDYKLLRHPEIIETLVHAVPEKKIDNVETDSSKTLIRSDLRNRERNSFSSNSNFDSNDNHKNSTVRKQEEEIFKIIHAMNPKNTNFHAPLKTNIPNTSKNTANQNKITTLVKGVTKSDTTDTTTESHRNSHYFHSDFTNKSDETTDSNFTCIIRPTHRRSKSLPHTVRKVCFAMEDIPCINNETKKNITKAAPTVNDKRPQSEDRNRFPINKLNPILKSTSTLNKNIDQCCVSHPFVTNTSPDRSSPRKNEESKNITTNNMVIYNSNDVTETRKDRSEEKQLKIKNRKKWNFPFLDDAKKSREKNIDKANKKNIIKQLSKLSDMSSVASATDSSENKILNDNNSTEEEIINASKSISKEVVNKKSRIFSTIKKYSKHLLPSKKYKSVSIPEKLKSETKSVEILKTPNLANNHSTMPVFIYSEIESSPTRSLVQQRQIEDNKNPTVVLIKPQEANSINKVKTNNKVNEKIDKFCQIQPDMINKGTVQSNESILTNSENEVITKESDRNIDVFLIPGEDNSSKTKVRKKLDKFCQMTPVMINKGTVQSNESIFIHKTSKTNSDNVVINKSQRNNIELSPKTLLVSSIDSIFQNKSRSSTAFLSNVIILNSSQNRPILSEQSSDNHLNNFSIQTSSLDNLIPTFFWNDYPPRKNKISNKLITLPVEEDTTNNYGFNEASESTDLKVIFKSRVLQEKNIIKKTYSSVYQETVSIQPNAEMIKLFTYMSNKELYKIKKFNRCTPANNIIEINYVDTNTTKPKPKKSVSIMTNRSSKVSIKASKNKVEKRGSILKKSWDGKRCGEDRCSGKKCQYVRYVESEESINKHYKEVKHKPTKEVIRKDSITKWKGKESKRCGIDRCSGKKCQNVTIVESEDNLKTFLKVVTKKPSKEMRNKYSITRWKEKRCGVDRCSGKNCQHVTKVESEESINKPSKEVIKKHSKEVINKYSTTKWKENRCGVGKCSGKKCQNVLNVASEESIKTSLREVTKKPSKEVINKYSITRGNENRCGTDRCSGKKCNIKHKEIHKIVSNSSFQSLHHSPGTKPLDNCKVSCKKFEGKHHHRDIYVDEKDLKVHHINNPRASNISICTCDSSIGIVSKKSSIEIIPKKTSIEIISKKPSIEIIPKKPCPKDNFKYSKEVKREEKLTHTHSKCHCPPLNLHYGPGEVPNKRKHAITPSNCNLKCNQRSGLLSLIQTKGSYGQVQPKSSSHRCCCILSNTTLAKNQELNTSITGKESFCNCSKEIKPPSTPTEEKHISRVPRDRKKCNIPFKESVDSRNSGKLSIMRTYSSESLSRECRQPHPLKTIKNKLIPKFSCKFFKNLYRRKSKIRKSRNPQCGTIVITEEASRKSSGTFICGCSSRYTASYVHSIHFNMQRMNDFDDDSYTENESKLTPEERKRYLDDKFFLLQKFCNQNQNEASSSRYGMFE